MRVLLLGGTAEARDLAGRIAGRPDIHLTVSLAGETRAAQVGDIDTRIGGFGSAAAFRGYLSAHAIERIVDATHPFAARISKRTAEIAAEMNVPYLQLMRPPWEPGPSDDWTAIPDEEAASAHVEPGDRVFLATGRKTLERFSNLRADHIWCRQIDPPEGPFPFPKGEFIVGRPPFTVEEEVLLFRKLGIDWLIVKNAGGDASRSKLDAAREIGLKVLMIDRPPPLEAPRVETVAQVMRWISE